MGLSFSRAVNLVLIYELVSFLYRRYQEPWSLGDHVGITKKIAGFAAIAMVIALAVIVIVSAPLHGSKKYSMPTESGALHDVVDGLHIALPENLRYIAIEQLVPLP